MNIGCPYCKQTLGCDESHNGTAVECPACGKTFEVRFNPDMEESKSDLGKWLVTSGEHAFSWVCRSLQCFLKRERPVETDVSRFKNAASTFELSRLFPLAVICLGWGWLASFVYANPNLFVDSDSRWVIIPIAILALYGSVRAFRHFVRLKTMQWVPLVATCLFTATVGVVGLLVFQWVAVKESNSSSVFIRVAGICYRYVYDSNASWQNRIIGLVCGVGFYEEATKLLPICLLVACRRKLPFKLDLSFRSFLMFGFFSGLGFGIGEALVCYPVNSSQEYADQLVRWFACVPSHAVYAVMDAAVLWMLRTRLSKAQSELVICGWLALCVAVAAVMHGIYNVLCAVDFMSAIVDAASLVLMWWIVRFAVQRKPSFDGIADGFEDFETSTVKTFGKSFAKTYLVVFIGILVYAGFFVRDLEKEVERRFAKISETRKPFNVFDVIGPSNEPTEAPARFGYTASTSQVSEKAAKPKQRPPLYLQVVNGEVDPPRIAGHAENPRTGLLYNPNGPLDSRAEVWNALVIYGKSGKRPHDPPTMYEQIMLGERNVPFFAGHHFDGATGKLYNPNGPLDMRAELWNAQIGKDTSGEAYHESPTLYEQVLRGERNVPVFAGHHFDEKTGKLYNPNGPLDPRAEEWNFQIDESNRNAGR